MIEELKDKRKREFRYNSLELERREMSEQKNWRSGQLPEGSGREGDRDSTQEKTKIGTLGKKESGIGALESCSFH